MEQLLEYNFLSKTRAQEIENYLTQSVQNKNKKELLKIATLLHDIAKSWTEIEQEDGTTSAPGHEMFGSIMVKQFQDRFNLKQKSKKRITKIVRFHGFPHAVVSQILDKGDLNNWLNKFKLVVGEIYLELLLLSYADVLGSDLKQSHQTEYEKRISIIRKILKSDHLFN